MASKNLRKLFPLSATSYNQSLDCPDFCDPSCPYNCPYPDFYFLPPPPPPPEHSGHSLHLSLAAIVSVSVLAGIFLVLSYFFMIARSCLRNRNGARTRTGSNDSEEEDFVEESRVEHPVWLIATVGLRPAVINSITACKYKKSEGLVEGTECSVCLTEFEEDETVRILPKCNHAFHIPCIDTWLSSHTNCPLCRASIVSEPPQGEAHVGSLVNGDGHREEENRGGAEDETELPKDGDSVVIDIVVEEASGVGAEPRQPTVSMDCSSVVGGGEECSSGSDKLILKDAQY